MLYATSAVLVIGVGLLWRSSFLGLPPFLAKYGGSAWWALLVFLCVGFVAPRAGTRFVAFWATAFSFGIEFSQIYHAPWIDELRALRMGALVLGSIFSWADLPAYAVGIVAGATLESVLRKPGGMAPAA